MSYRITQETLDFLNSNGVKITGRDSNGWEWELGSDIEYGDSFTLEALDGFTIISITYRGENGWDESLTISSDGLTATNNSFDDTPLTDYNIVTESEVLEPDYVISEQDLQGIINGVLYVNDELAITGMGVNIGDQWKYIPDDGYLVNEIRFRDEDGFDYQWIIAPDLLSATYIHDDKFTLSGIEIFTTNVQPDDVRGINDVYKITPDNIRELIKESFKQFDGQLTTDFGRYILGLIEIPFTIPDDFIIGDSVINFGEFSTGIDGVLLNNDTLKVDMGSISVAGDKGNLLDYSNVIAVLHLPYAEPMTLENEYVINETVSIEYVVNLYDGNANINVSSSKSGGVIASRTVDLRLSVPFGNIDSYPANNSPYAVQVGGDNGIDTPFIELLQNKAILENGLYTVPIIDESVISDFNGFIIVEDINLKTKANYNDKMKIINQLNRGIIL